MEIKKLKGTLFLDNKSIKEGVSKPSGDPPTYPGGDESVKIIAQSIVNDSTSPIFSYYNKNYPGDLTNNPLSTPIKVDDVRLIKIH